MKPDFLKRIKKNVILADGALGSYLYEQGVDLSHNLDLLNLHNSELVHAAHEEYIRAGSQLIETNTFGANRFKLSKAGADKQVIDINRAGARIGVKAAGHQVYVAGSVGPTGVKFPLALGDITEDDLRAGFAEQFEGLLEGGVDLLLLETFGHLDEILIAISVAKEMAAGVPVVAQMVFPSKARNKEGIDAKTCAHTMRLAGADIVGTNCGRGVDAVLDAIQTMNELDDDNLYLSAFPNAGLPEVVGHRMLYPVQPAYMAARAKDMLRYGVRLIGGCCGTTPAHIHEFKNVLPIRQVRSKASPRPVVGQQVVPPVTEVPAQSAGGFLNSLRKNRLPIIVEIDPPHHLDIDHVMNGARQLSQAGIEAISMGENPLAILRAGNLGMARLIKEEFGVQPIIHQTGRDLNALGLQSRMMEAHLLGIEAVLAVTGDSASGSDQPGVSGVFDLDSFGIINMLNQLNRGKNLAGQTIRGGTNFSIGAAFSFRPQNPDLQIRRIEKKAALGAGFAMTQPLFSARAVEEMMDKVNHIDMLIFPAIFPLISSRNAEFLHNEVPGIIVPAAIREKLARYDKVEDQRRAAMDITRELVADIVPFVDGLYFISPLNKWEVVVEFVKEIRERDYRGTGKQRSLAVSPTD
jgi:methionine synthase I (cobalamin-dependent)/5,10-methylenetetrahydrofolate reductase